MGKELIRVGVHHARSIRSIRIIERDGWRVKLYGISQATEFPDETMLSKAEDHTWSTLPLPASTETRYGVGFVAVHQAVMFNQIIVDWWERENELRHRVFKAEPSAPTEFEEITAGGEAFCVWELRILSHERDAWMRHVLEGEGEKRLEGYLGDVLNEDC